MKKVYIIHGYGASPFDHWFSWFVDKVRATYGLEVEVLAMPTPQTPNVEAWLATLRHNIGVPNTETYIIAHSLGCITLLRYLHEVTESFTLGGMVLVSPFDQPLALLPVLDPFVATPLDYAKLSRNTLQKHIIFSDNDAYVPPHISKTLGSALDCALHEIPRGGHFLGAEGFEMFPELFEIFRQMMNKH